MVIFHSYVKLPEGISQELNNTPKATRPGERSQKANWKMAIEIVDFPIKNGDFPWQNVSSPEGNQ